MYKLDLLLKIKRNPEALLAVSDNVFKQDIHFKNVALHLIETANSLSDLVCEKYTSLTELVTSHIETDTDAILSCTYDFLKDNEAIESFDPVILNDDLNLEFMATLNDGALSISDEKWNEVEDFKARLQALNELKEATEMRIKLIESPPMKKRLAL